MHRFDLRSWNIIKQFAGIYNVKGVNYTILSPESANSTFNSYISDLYRNMKLVPNNIYFGYKNMKPIYIHLAKGYKSQLFYQKIAHAYSHPCVCCKGKSLVYGKRRIHCLDRKHIKQIKSGNFDQIILQKYKFDPLLFRWIDYSGFRVGIWNNALHFGYGNDRHTITLAQ
tara:strand:- start:771 stop:1280 length:510 start_codon:yes stop_codon:yes gene_type:complete